MPKSRSARDSDSCTILQESIAPACLLVCQRAMVQIVARKAHARCQYIVKFLSSFFFGVGKRMRPGGGHALKFTQSLQFGDNWRRPPLIIFSFQSPKSKGLH
jgi:hypothetical protein